MKNIYTITLLLLSILTMNAQQKPSIVIIPEDNFGICMQLDEKFSQSIEVLEERLKTQAYDVRSFAQNYRKVKRAGNCNQFNLLQTQINIAKEANSEIYMTLKIVYSMGKLNITVAALDTSGSTQLAHKTTTTPYHGTPFDYSQIATTVSYTVMNELFTEFEEELLHNLGKYLNQSSVESQNKPKLIDIEQNIPQTNMQNPNAIAVVIGNQNYEHTQNSEFALKDARLIKKYLMQTLGYQEDNIFYLEDCKKGDFELHFGTQNNYEGKLFNAVKEDITDIFIYYVGLGAPSKKNKGSYFLPIDCDPNYLALTAYSMATFYDNLAKIPAKSMTVVLDTYWSGKNTVENTSSSLMVKSKGIAGIEEGVLWSACLEDEVANVYEEMQHGLFTYFFLKAIHNQNADLDKNSQLTLEEIHDYISNQTEGVPYFAKRLHGLKQHPTLQGEYLDKVFIEY